nr:laccase-12-like [Ipomoea trifida]GMD12843.1 laccase-12-like [Ipomoea batatas]GME10425.1 laccase-12-like [Ipomoea batatas]
MEAFSHSIAKSLCPFLFIGILVLYANAFSLANAEVQKHQFVIQATPVKRLCNTHNTIAVNVQFPGPTLE